ncbi:hypothetical protein Tco_0413400 [Tanacetum coccineum]
MCSKEQHNSAAADNGPQDKQSNGAHDGSPLTAIGQCIERKDWRFQSNGDIRSHPGEPIKVANALSRMMLCALNVKERLCRFCEAMIWLRTLVEGYIYPSVDEESNRDLVKIISKELGHLASQVNCYGWLDGKERGYQGRIIGEPLSPDCVSYFPVGRVSIAPPMITSHSTTTRYDGNPNNNNGGLRRCPFTCRAWSGTVVGMDEDIAMLFGDNNFDDDDSEGFDKEAVWEVNEEWLMAPITPPLMPAVQPPGVYEVGGPSTAAAEG